VGYKQLGCLCQPNSNCGFFSRKATNGENMFIITRVEIEGFWGKYKISTDLHPDINIFIGKNGTGKTTFINMLSAVLKGDLKSLLGHDFQKITILLSDEHTKNRTISVTKSESPETSLQNVVYKIGTKSYKFSIRDVDILVRNPRRRTPMGESLNELESEISKLVNISSLIHRKLSYLKFGILW
jgi:predicted ATP-dependent endonuclease of OLD family